MLTRHVSLSAFATAQANVAHDVLSQRTSCLERYQLGICRPYPTAEHPSRPEGTSQERYVTLLDLPKHAIFRVLGRLRIAIVGATLLSRHSALINSMSPFSVQVR